MQSQLAGMVAGGLFEAVRLRVVLTESGLAWVAALRWSLDAAWEVMREDHPRLRRRPSEYVDEHVWFTTQPIEEPDDPQHLVYAIEQARLQKRLLFATDYPHWDFDSAQAGAAPGAGNRVAQRRAVRQRPGPVRAAPRTSCRPGRLT